MSALPEAVLSDSVYRGCNYDSRNLLTAKPQLYPKDTSFHSLAKLFLPAHRNIESLPKSTFLRPAFTSFSPNIIFVHRHPPTSTNIHQHPRHRSPGVFIYPFTNTSALLNTNQGSDMPLGSTTSSSRAAARPNEPKPNSSRETNTADISPPAVPPPAYTAVHNDVNGERPLDRERGYDYSLPPYTERGDGETNNTGNNYDLEAGVAEQAPPRRQRRRQRAVLRRQNQHLGGVILAIFIAILVYMAFRYHWIR
jgi:hypothetical protein